ncbi:host cell factor 1-like [Diorhabda carinulata]|uniref:host cell factor 1-like n=1 Tax=Diorhabda carinulata TaxID=1163345 RepID=UPI0025A0FF44|nr:host cell factor 1-like [Diorhabda carinulata]
MKSKCDPLNNLVLWKYVPNPTGFLPFPRHGHRAIAIKDLIFVFGGGEKRLFNDLMVYYIEKNIWLCPKITGNVPPECTAHGLVVDGTRLLVFGGLLENNQFSNDLYELKAQKWEWTKLAPKPPKSGPLPYPRFGHSFTLVKSEVYLFGGLANIGVPKFLNDLYTLNIRNSPLEWVIPQTKGSSPPPREFHTGVAYIDQKGHSFLVIYGGKNGLILGDLWVLNIETMSWIEPKTSGIAPLPRYFHSSIVIRNRMFVFGGRVSVGTDDQASECTNNLICLNLETMNWDNLVIQVDPKANLPCARSGHCAVGIETRIYIWSGQDMDQKKCLQDLWFVDVDKPPPPTGLRWVKNFIFTWKNPLFVDYNMLEIEKVSLPSPPPYSPTMSPASSLGSTPESSQASTPESTRADIPESSRAYRPESSRASTLESSRADIPESSRADIPESSRAYRPESSRAYIPESSRASSTYKAESDTSEPEYLFAPHPNYKFIMMVARNEAIRKKQRKKSNSLKDKGILSKLKLSSAKSKIKIKVSSLIGKRPMPKSKAVLDSSTPNVKSIKKVKTKKKVINSEK